MGLRSQLRVVIALAFALTAVSALASPAAAEIVLDQCTGTCGYWQVTDMQVGGKGADCVYINSMVAPNLKQITVRPPLMHGNYANKTKVSWRFKIQREPPSSMSFNTLYTSSWQTAKADDSIPAYAGHGFARRSWSAPSNPHGYFRVWVEMRFWNQAGSAVEGTARVQYDWYKAIRGGNTYTDESYCLEDY